MTQLSGDPPPSADEVRVGTGSGGGLPVASGALLVDVAGEDGEARGSVAGLIRDTSYSTYFVAVDRAEPSPNAQPAASSIRHDRAETNVSLPLVLLLKIV